MEILVVALIYFLFLFLSAYVGSRRGRAGTGLVLGIFLGVLGLIIVLLLPTIRTCPQCNATVSVDAVLCPRCRSTLKALR